MNPIREQVIEHLEKLNDDQVVKVLEFIETIEDKPANADYDETNDPLVGFFSGPSNLAEQSEEILQKEFGHSKPQDTNE